MRQFVKDIINKLDTDPDNWGEDGFTVFYKGRGHLSIWTANGFMFLAVNEPIKVSFGLFEKFAILRAIRRAKAKRVQNLLKTI